MQADTTEVSEPYVDQRPSPDSASASFLGQLRAQAKPVLRQLSVAAALAAAGMTCFSAAVALAVNAAMHSQAPSPWLWLLGIIGITLRLLANLWRDRKAQWLSAQIRNRLRDQLLAQATTLGPSRLARKGNTAWWAHQCLEQVDALHGYLARYLPARQAATVIPAIVIAITSMVDWIAGILILLATPIIPIFMALIGWGTEAVHRTQQDQQASLAAHLMDRLQALPWLRRMGATHEAERDVGTAAQNYRKISMRVLRVAFLSSATLEFFSAVSIGLMAIYIGFALVGLITYGPADQVTLASGLFMLMLAPECFMPLRQLAQTHHDMNAAKASAQTLAELINTDSVLQIPPTIITKTDSAAAASLDDVTLCWPDAASPVLRHINLRVMRGEILGIAGDSGQGKSTLINLMAGFVSPTSGSVSREANWAWLGQRPHLFHATLRENLLLGTQTPMSDASLENLLAGVGLALPNPLLPGGLDTPIGEANQGVSGGQAQRITLCRAMASDARLWLLDEPTAALDAGTREVLLGTMMAHVKSSGITLVIASHDNDVLSRCDRVVLIKDGSLQEIK